MSVIEASSGTYRSRVDGTIVLSVEIEPRFRAEALALFGMPGTPMALAALKTATHAPEKADKPKGGLLSQWAAMRCQEPAFQKWLASTWPASWERAHERGGTPTDLAAETVRLACLIQSRADLDSDEEAAARFHELIRGPWQKHCIATGAAA